MKFQHMTVALDMLGCPNRCKHCWIGHSPNGHLTAEDLRFAAVQFRPYADQLTVYDWYREPDYGSDYRAMWELCNQLSDGPRDHFELISVWRMAHDADYVKWLASLGMKAAQLTLFGSQEKTDYYTGRKNAYADILHAIDTLLAHGIAPRIQVFVNKDNVDELPLIQQLIHDMELEKRCAAIGSEFTCFLHQGSCDGENEKLYDIRVTPEDLSKIPQKLADYSLKHWQAKDLAEIFGQTEQSLYEALRTDDSTASFVSDAPVFYIDKDFNVYPNIQPSDPAWLLGNLKTDGPETVLENYVHSRSKAQHTRLTVPLSRMVEACGDPHSQRLFDKDDYIEYLLNNYCRQ